MYSEYSEQSHQYIFPSHLLDDLYQQIIQPFTVIDIRPEFRQLPIMGLKSFPSLFNKADEHIKDWNSTKQTFEEDLQYLASTIPHIYPLPYDLEHTFREIDRDLAELTAQKDNTLHLVKPNIRGVDDLLYVHGPITINLTRATFQYTGNQSKTINVNNREFRFFMHLFQHKGKVINYIDFVSYLNLNVSTKGLDVSQAQDLIRDIKKRFGRRLKESGVGKDDVTKVMDSIVAIRSEGYKLIDIS